MVLIQLFFSIVFSNQVASASGSSRTESGGVSGSKGRL